MCKIEFINYIFIGSFIEGKVNLRELKEVAEKMEMKCLMNVFFKLKESGYSADLYTDDGCTEGDYIDSENTENEVMDMETFQMKGSIFLISSYSFKCKISFSRFYTVEIIVSFSP